MSNPTLDTAGSGWTGLISQPAQIGSAHERTIAKWAAIPQQEVTGQFNIGVAAYHLDGIDRVEFSLENGPWVKVYQPSTNPRTGRPEYWVTFDTTSLSDGPAEIRAIAYPITGLPFVLQGGPNPEQKRDEMVLQVNNGGTLSFPVVELAAGTHSLNPRSLPEAGWLTVRPAPGVAKADCVIDGTSRYWNDAGNLRIQGVTWTAPNNGGICVGNTNDTTFQRVWFDDVDFYGYMSGDVPRTVSGPSQWHYSAYTNCYFTDFDRLFKNQGRMFIRDCHIGRHYQDIWESFGGYISNVLVDNHDKGTNSSFHNDVWDSDHAFDGIYEDITVTRSEGQGLFLENFYDSAMVRVVVNSVSTGRALQLQDTTYNVLLKDCQFNGSTALRDSLGFNIPAGERFVWENVVAGTSDPYLPSNVGDYPNLILRYGLTNPVASATGETTADSSVSTGISNGTLYHVVLPANAAAPLAADVVNGTDGDGNAAAFSSSMSISSTGTKSFSATSLVAGTAYVSYFYQEGTSQTSSVIDTAEFTTATLPDYGTIGVTGLDDPASGDIQVTAAVTGSTVGISTVSFAIDGVDVRTESQSPYSLAGDEGPGSINPYDTNQLADGLRTLTVTVTYTDAHTESADFTFTVDNSASVDTTPPTVSSVVIGTSGTTTDITFDEAMSEVVSDVEAGFDYLPDHVITDTQWQTDSVLRFHHTPVLGSAVVTMDYDATQGHLTDVSENALATFSGQAVTNNSTVADPSTADAPATGWTAWTPPKFAHDVWTDPNYVLLIRTHVNNKPPALNGVGLDSLNASDFGTLVVEWVKFAQAQGYDFATKGYAIMDQGMVANRSSNTKPMDSAADSVSGPHGHNSWFTKVGVAQSAARYMTFWNHLKSRLDAESLPYPNQLIYDDEFEDSFQNLLVGDPSENLWDMMLADPRASSEKIIGVNKTINELDAEAPTYDNTQNMNSATNENFAAWARGVLQEVKSAAMTRCIWDTASVVFGVEMQGSNYGQSYFDSTKTFHMPRGANNQYPLETQAEYETYRMTGESVSNYLERIARRRFLREKEGDHFGSSVKFDLWIELPGSDWSSTYLDMTTQAVIGTIRLAHRRGYLSHVCFWALDSHFDSNAFSLMSRVHQLATAS